MVVPPKYRKRLLSDLHEGHPGITHMKALARSHLWWPGLDQDIQQCVSQCSPCEAVHNMPAAAPLIPWSWAAAPWERIHVDYAEINKQHFLVITDVHSKWMEVFPTQLMTAEKTIDLLRHLFAAYGLTKELVSDNGPPFTSAQFETFLRSNGVQRTLSPPYHPATNGAAERAVQVFKKAWTKQEVQSVPTHQRLARFLFSYRNTPHTVTERKPAELFLRRQPRTRLTLLKPDLSETVVKHQLQQKKGHDRHTKPVRHFDEGERVKVRNFRHPKCQWNSGIILHRKGPLTYTVQVGQRQVSVHVDHLLRSNVSSSRLRDAILHANENHLNGLTFS